MIKDEERDEGKVHLRATRSDRGFVRMPDITGTYPGKVSVYESSGASMPQVWVKVECPINLNEPRGEWQDAVVHLDAEDAVKLAEQLLFLVEHHYQTCDRDKREQALASAERPQ